MSAISSASKDPIIYKMSGNQNLTEINSPGSRVSTPVILRPKQNETGGKGVGVRDYRREREQILRGRRAVSVNNRLRGRSNDLLRRMVTKEDIRGQSSTRRRNSFRADDEVMSPKTFFKK